MTSGRRQRRVPGRRTPLAGTPRPVVATIVAAALVGAVLAVIGPDTGAFDAARGLRLIYGVLGALIVIGLLRRARAAHAPESRWAWSTVAAAATIVFLVLLGLYFDPTVSGRLIGPQRIDLPQMLVAPIVAGGLLVLVRPAYDRALALRTLMDGAAIASSTVVLAWYVVIRPLHDAGSEIGITATAAMGFVVLDAVAFALGLLVLSRSSFDVRAIVAVGVVGLAALLFADVSRLVQFLPAQPETRTISELGWLGALVCFAAWAWMAPRGEAALQRPAAGGWPWWLTLPYTFLLPVAAVLVVSAFRDDADRPMILGAAAIIVVLGFRHVIALKENEALTGRLTRSVHQLAHRAEHDELTGLLNRGGVIERLNRLRTTGAGGPGQPVTLLFVDLDRFKGINDTLGHAVGDVVLRTVGERLRRMFDGTSGVAARLAGDEFVLLLPGLASETEALGRAQEALEVVERPIPLSDGGEIFVTASVGVALSGRLTDGEAMVREADLAMFEAKSGGRARVQLFEEDLRQRSEDRMRIEQDLRRSLALPGAFAVHLQPMVLLGEDRLWGAEALVRWEHPALGLLYPGRFLPVAEESGMIVPLGAVVLAEACAAAVAVPGMIASVNLSPRQIHDPLLVSMVRHQLDAHGLAPDRLCLEVTEEVLVDARTVVVLEELQALGVRVAIDDFGVGASSLRQLRRIPGAVVKIDRTFVERLDGDRGGDDRVLCRALVSVADQLGLMTVAEGIERRGQLEVVRDLGITIGQGWYLGTPQAAATFVAARSARPEPDQASVTTASGSSSGRSPRA